MVTITVGNNWGDIYANALKKDGIEYLMEIDRSTNFTFEEKDFKRTEVAVEKARDRFIDSVLNQTINLADHDVHWSLDYCEEQ